ncbi:hypothetical protein GCM10027347_54150 [Larkinella harenae]
MKRIVFVCSLIWLLIACEKAGLSPQSEFLSPNGARQTTDDRTGESSKLLIGKKAPLTRYTITKNREGTFDIVFQYDRNTSEAVTGISLREAASLNDLLRVDLPKDYEANRPVIAKNNGTPVVIDPTRPDLFEWLQNNPSVAEYVTWNDAQGPHRWPEWSATEKTQLWVAFCKAWQGNSIFVPEIPLNRNAHSDRQGTLLSVDDAWAYYRSSVAHSLALELGKRVHWSVRNYSTMQLFWIFSSNGMFTWKDYGSVQGYVLFQSVTPGPPLASYQFLKNQGMIGTTRLATIGRTLDWCRYNLSHTYGTWSDSTMNLHYQYWGRPPMTRILSGSVYSLDPGLGLRHWTPGCGGTAAFLRMLLRTVNIPVGMAGSVGHSQVHFMTEGYYLDHGDTPYSSLAKDPVIGAGELLITEATYKAWFDQSLPEDTRLKNVGRRNRELAIKYLPKYLLHLYCEDQRMGKTHANGKVFETLSKTYTLQHLEAQNLWGRMDSKISAMGGCSNVPYQ